MKAIVLALDGGESLWPIPAGVAGLDVTLLGLSLLEWNARALREAGADELVLALPEGAQVPVQGALPMSVRRFPAGAAEPEALLACGEGLEGTFFALSGGLMWSGGLRPALESHAAEGCALTRVEFRPVPPFPGTMGEEKGGRVLPFPAAAETLGLAVCSPALLPFLTGARDWAQVFARLRSAGALGAAEVAGRCLRMDRPAALLDAVAELLCAKSLPGMGRPLRPGIWSASPVPEEVELVAPCVIGAGVRLGGGSLIGPHAVLEDGVEIGDHTLVQRSVLQREVRVGSRASLYGAFVCRRAVLGSYTVLNEGAAVGPDAQIGDNAALMEDVGVGAGGRVPPSARLTESFPTSRVSPAWTVEGMLFLGRRLGRCGLVGTGGAGFRGLLLARAFGCGAAAQGAAVVLHDGVLPCQGAWLAEYYRWPASLFADENGQVYLFDDQGRTLAAPPPDGDTGEGSWDLLAGTASAWAAAHRQEEAQAAFQPFSARGFL